MGFVGKRTCKTRNKMSGGFDIIKAIALLFSATLIFVILVGGEKLFSSDSLASDIIVQELRATGSLSINSYMSQQTFWIINLPYWLPKYLLNLFINNTIVVDKITISMMYILLLFLSFYVAYKYSENKSAGWLTLCVLGSGISIEWFLWEIIEPAYTIHIIYMFVFLIMGSNMVDEMKIKWNPKCYFQMLVMSLFLIYILSFDQRYAAIFVLPFCVSLLAITYFEYYKVETIRKIEKRVLINLSTIELALLCAAAVGLLCNGGLKCILPFVSRLTNVDSYNFADFESFFEQVAIYILSIFKLWGAEFYTSVSTISLKSVFYLVKCCICVTVMVIIPIMCTIRYKMLPEKIQFLLVFYWVLSLELFYIYGLSVYNSTSGCRYYVYDIPIAVIISSWYCWERLIKPHNLNRYLLEMCIIIFCTISQMNIVENIKNYSIQYDIKRQAIETLQEHNLTFGYASYWNAQILTSMSNTEIKVLPVGVSGVLVPFYSLNYIHQFDASTYSGNTFLLLEKEEYENILDGDASLYQEIGMPKEIVETDGYNILIYEYNVAKNAKYFPYNAAYIPAENTYTVKKSILEESEIEIGCEYTVNAVAIPINIVSDSYYKFEFTAQFDDAEWCFLEFMKEGYDYTETARGVDIEDGETKYEGIIYTGEYEDVNEAILRIVCKNAEPVQISHLKISLIEVY